VKVQRHKAIISFTLKCNLQEREVCTFTNSFGISSSSRSTAENSMQKCSAFSQNRLLLMKTVKQNGERRAVDYNDIYTIALSDTMHHVSAITEIYHADVLKHFKK
jgi:hypothetical protein